MEFERNYTENSDQSHVELRVKEKWGCFRVSWRLHVSVFLLLE